MTSYASSGMLNFTHSLTYLRFRAALKYVLSIVEISLYISVFVRFTLVQKTGSPCSSLAFALHRRSEFLVGMADRSLKCFDAGLCHLVCM